MSCGVYSKPQKVDLQQKTVMVPGMLWGPGGNRVVKYGTSNSIQPGLPILNCILSDSPSHKFW